MRLHLVSALQKELIVFGGACLGLLNIEDKLHQLLVNFSSMHIRVRHPASPTPFIGCYYHLVSVSGAFLTAVVWVVCEALLQSFGA